MSKVMRSDIADYIKIKSTNKFAFMGFGFNNINETVGAQIESKTYVNDKNETSTVKSYKRQFPYDTDMFADEAEAIAVEELYFIGRDSKVGSDAEREYVRVELFLPVTPGNTRYYKARKFKVAVEVTNFNGAGGEAMTSSGNLNCIGDPIQGYFDVVNKEFTAGDYTETLGTLTVNSAAGATSGTTKITITEPLTSGYSYMYKTALSVTAPSLNDDCTGYTPWNGVTDITATTGNTILIVEVDDHYKAKKAGTATVTAKA